MDHWWGELRAATRGGSPRIVRLALSFMRELTDKLDTLLLVRVRLGFRQRRQQQYGRHLAFGWLCQQQGSLVWKLQRIAMGRRLVFVGLTEDCCLVVDGLPLPADISDRYAS